MTMVAVVVVVVVVRVMGGRGLELWRLNQRKEVVL